MTSTLHHRYPASKAKVVGRTLLRAPIKLPNKLLGSQSGPVRMTSRFIVLAGCVALMWTVWAKMQDALLHPAEQRMASGRVLDHVHSGMALGMAALGWVVFAAIVGGALHALAALSDRSVKGRRVDTLDVTAAWVWVVVAISAFVPAVATGFPNKEPDDAQVAPLYFTEPKPVYLANGEREAIELAADLHLALGACRPYEVSVDYNDLNTLACRTKKGITLKLAKAADPAAAPAA